MPPKTLEFETKSGFILKRNRQSLDQGLSSAAVVLVYSVELRRVTLNEAKFKKR